MSSLSRQPIALISLIPRFSVLDGLTVKLLLTYPMSKVVIEILKVHAKNKRLTDDIDIETIAKRTPGFLWCRSFKLTE